MEGVAQSGRVDGGIPYPYGFGYQVLTNFAASVSGFTVADWQLFAYPIMGALPALVAYPMFARLLRERLSAILGAFLFMIQPDLLFTTYRSTHEKFTWILMLTVLLLFLIATTKRPRSSHAFFRPGAMLCLYFVMFGLFSFNLFFSNMFLLILALGFILGRLRPTDHDLMRLSRLAYLWVVGMVLFFSLMLYIYEPALVYLRGVANYGELVLVSLLSFETHTTPQYTFVAESWPSIYVWMGLTFVTWLVIGVSTLSFGRSFIKRSRPNGRRTLALPQSLYAGASLIVLASAVADRFVGFSSNLELRLVPVLMIFAAPIAAHELIRWTRRESQIASRKRVAILLALVVVAVPVSVLKASVEPSVSNLRIYATPEEVASVNWILNVHFESQIWTDPEGRTLSVAHLVAPYSEFERYRTELGGNTSSAFYLLSGNVIAVNPDAAAALEKPTDSIIYANGDSFISMH